MIDSVFHIELDGVTYKLAQDAEGTHHNLSGESLRPPNAVTVQGRSSQEFQPRPDLLLWDWTDWSDGEGRRKLVFGESGRSWQLNGVRAFEEPGHLLAGYFAEIAQDSTGAADIALDLALVVAGGSLYGLDKNAANSYLWDGTKFGAAVAETGVTAGCSENAVGDGTAVYWIEYNTNNVWKWDLATTYTKISDTTITAGVNNVIEQTADYVYVYNPDVAKVWEIPKTGASDGVEIDSWTEPSTVGSLARLHGQIYVLVSQPSGTALRQITPSSAAGTGFGGEVSTYEGFQGTRLWSHSGSLFTLGQYQTAETNRTVIWDTPGGEFGTLGEVRSEQSMLTGFGGGGRMLDHFFVQEQRDGTDTNHALMQVDSVTGGISNISYDEVGDATGEDPGSLVVFNGDIFWSTDRGAATKRTMRARKDQYMQNWNAVSPEHDFDLASEKYLGSLVLSMEALPANWTVYVDYRIDGGAWVTGITHTTTGGFGETLAISTDSATVQFRTLQLRVRGAHTTAAPTTTPVILGVEARAAVVRKVRVTQLLLDLSNDTSAGAKSTSGADKVTAFLATAIKETVVDFKDGFTSPNAGVYDQYDVTVDTYNVVLSQPGEGIGVVTLREVV